jgi:hypothetical protein
MLSYTNSFKYKHTLENTEGAIKNAQSRETGKTKKNKTKTQHNMCWTPLVISSRFKLNIVSKIIKTTNSSMVKFNLIQSMILLKTNKTQEKQNKNTTQYVLDTTIHKQSQIT